ncbi:MAG: PEP-CTERM sorting domain-containing protein [Akkermansia sp.]|nr:PEP-CTERM sorting domain-containing protein [Akkermansia sp.]
MKKTFITLLALAGVAMGETVTYDILADQENWQMGCGRYSAPSFNADGSIEGSGWAQMYANYRFDSAITLTEGQTLEFSYDITSKSNNAIHSFTFETASDKVMIGNIAYENQTLGLGTTTSSSNNGYIASGGWGTSVSASAMTNKEGGNFAYTPSTAYNVSGSITLKENSYVMTIEVNDTEYATVNLGADFSLTGVVFSLDGDNDAGTGTQLSNLSLSVVTPDVPSGNIPEPATATLSLLALAGLAARRRRK